MQIRGKIKEVRRNKKKKIDEEINYDTRGNRETEKRNEERHTDGKQGTLRITKAARKKSIY